MTHDRELAELRQKLADAEDPGPTGAEGVSRRRLLRRRARCREQHGGQDFHHVVGERRGLLEVRLERRRRLGAVGTYTERGGVGGAPEQVALCKLAVDGA